MEIEKYLNGIRYTLSNDNLEVNDKVFPIVSGRVREDGTFVIHNIEFESKYVKGLNTSGFPNEPHTILDLKYSDYKPYEVRTDCGFSPKERYFKIVSKEKRFTEYKETESGLKFKSLDEWRLI